MTLLRHGGFLLRPFQTSDAPAFAAAVRESVDSLAAWMPWAHADYGEDEALAWFAACDANRASGSAYEFGIFTADGAGFVGGAGLNQFDLPNARCNLGYWVRQAAQRRGAASAALAALTQHGFAMLQLQRIEIIVAEGNAASFGVATKAGALHEGLARHRLKLHDRPVAAHVFSVVPTGGG